MRGEKGILWGEGEEREGVVSIELNPQAASRIRGGGNSNLPITQQLRACQWVSETTIHQPSPTT